MAPIVDTRIDYFLHASATWLNWSLFDKQWDPKYVDRTKTEKKIRLTIAYVAGMVGHVLCAVTKIVELALFVLLSLGFALKFAMTLCINYLKRKEKDTEAINRENTLYKYRLYESLLITAGSLTASLIDIVGIVCPPIAYHIHQFMHEKCMFDILHKWSVVEKIGEFVFDAYIIELV